MGQCVCFSDSFTKANNYVRCGNAACTEASGGRTWCESDDQHEGTVFEVALCRVALGRTERRTRQVRKDKGRFDPTVFMRPGDPACLSVHAVSKRRNPDSVFLFSECVWARARCGANIGLARGVTRASVPDA